MKFQEGIGKGGPIEGNDISVYHVESDFILGANIKRPDKNEMIYTRDYIWPVCFPKTEKDIEKNNGTNR